MYVPLVGCGLTAGVKQSELLIDFASLVLPSGHLEQELSTPQYPASQLLVTDGHRLVLTRNFKVVDS